MTATDTRAKLSAAFEANEVRQFEGRGGKTFDYVEDETVMDRLDDALGVGNWSIRVEPISVADGIVKVTLEAIVDGKGTIHEDFGYANNTNGEALKEAVSDGIRRCGRYLGIARELYKKHPLPSTPSRAPVGQSRTTSSSPAAPPARPAAPLRPVDDLYEFDDDAPARSDNTECPIHNVPWNGEWTDLWHKTDDGGYCRHPDNIKRDRPKAGARR